MLRVCKLSLTVIKKVCALFWRYAEKKLHNEENYRLLCSSGPLPVDVNINELLLLNFTGVSVSLPLEISAGG